MGGVEGVEVPEAQGTSGPVVREVPEGSVQGMRGGARETQVGDRGDGGDGGEGVQREEAWAEDEG